MDENDKYKSFLKQFGKRLLKVREKLKMTQLDFAQQVNVTNSYVSEMEKGKVKPGYDFLIEVSRVYQLNLSWLLMGWGDMFFDYPGEGSGNSLEELANKDESIRHFLWHFKNSPLVKHTVIGYALKFLHDNKETVKKDIELNKTISGQ